MMHTDDQLFDGQLFPLGQIQRTNLATQALAAAGKDPDEFLLRHAQGDWGQVDTEDWERNDRAVERFMHILSSYHLAKSERLWIMTEADRSVTTLLLPEEN